MLRVARLLDAASKARPGAKQTALVRDIARGMGRSEDFVWRKLRTMATKVRPALAPTQDAMAGLDAALAPARKAMARLDAVMAQVRRTMTRLDVVMVRRVKLGESARPSKRARCAREK